MIKYKKLEINNYLKKKINLDFFIIPKNINQYLILKNNNFYYDKLLLPINNNNNIHKIYTNNVLTKNLKNLNYTNNINDANLVLYYNDMELNQIDNYDLFLNNKILIKLKNNIDEDSKKVLNLIKINNIKNKSYDEFMNNIHFDYNEIIINYNNFSNIFNFKKNQVYILFRENTIIYDKNKLLLDFSKKLYFIDYNIIIYKIDTKIDKEFVILCYFNKDTQISLLDLLLKNNFVENKVVGYNNTNNDISELYYLFGKAKLWDLYFPISKLHKKYKRILENKSSKYNYRKLLRVYSFNKGYDNKRLNINVFKNNFKKTNMDKLLLISKSIKGYGGNQKTARQLYNNLIDKYDVYVLSLSPSKNQTYTFLNDSLCESIHNEDIIKIKNYDKIIKHINETNYEIIINNKLNEYFNIIDKINKKTSVITHNSMDPFNRLILNHQKKIDKVFTINKIHSDLFIKNGLKCKILRYLNHIDIQNKVRNRKEFKYQLVFVGRLSREKNTNLLLEAIDYINNTGDIKIKLIVLGDGKDKFFKNLNNVEYFGKVNYDFVKLVLLNSDYLILPSSVEGLPFTILESMSMGIPCITSNINGINEVVNNSNGFLFDLCNYNKYKNNIDNWKILDNVDLNFDKNKMNLVNKIKEAYSIDIKKWNKMSENCFNLIKDKFSKDYVDRYNFISLYLY